MTLPVTPMTTLCEAMKSSSVGCIPLKEDGSDRQYFRVTPSDTKASLVLMQLHGKDASELKADSYSWISVGETLEKAHILVPQVHSIFKNESALLIDDFGNTTLDLRILDFQNDTAKIKALYAKATEILCAFLQIQPEASSTWTNRAFDYKLLHTELEFFRTHHLQNFSEFNNDRDSSLFNQDVDKLCFFISQAPRHFVHRDFHSRNLMCVQSELGVIDFQDARWGPAAYDLVSLCFDPYVCLNHKTRKLIFQSAIDTIGEKLGYEIKEELEQTWSAVLLQRLLKAIGSFAFLTRKGKRDYRIYIQPALETLQYFVEKNTQWPFLVEELVPRLLEISRDQKN